MRHCSFCGRGEDAVNILIPAADGRSFICDDCIFVCSDFIEEQFGGRYDAEETEAEETEAATTEAPATEAATTAAPATKAPETEAPEAKGGCGASVSVAGIALVAALGACTAFVAKKKED